MDIRSAQKHAWDNKTTKGFNTTDVPLEFGLLNAEVGEAFTAWRKGLPDAGEELADVFLYLVGLAEMTGVDLQDEVVRKLDKNRTRVYEPGENGALLRRDWPPHTPVSGGQSLRSLPDQTAAPARTAVVQD
ncbi:hypothetical protein ACN20G_26425 (plasmid) [Streptomyces sp. BI20]|uniref:hypothetical protein n=1 Tax=Streptomyces sp. BI20 TaxID=3403460 RepID=UPI003C756F97